MVRKPCSREPASEIGADHAALAPPRVSPGPVWSATLPTATTAKPSRSSCANFCAEVVLYEWDDVDIVCTDEDQQPLSLDPRPGPRRQAARLLRRHAADQGRDQEVRRVLPGARDTSCTTAISPSGPREHDPTPGRAWPVPARIIVATLRCLMDFYDVSIPRRCSRRWSSPVEAEELGIAAGLARSRDPGVRGTRLHGLRPRADARDRTVSSVAPMNRSTPVSCRRCTSPTSPIVSEPTEIFHNDIRGRFNRGEPSVVRAMGKFASLAAHARSALAATRCRPVGEVDEREFRHPAFDLPAAARPGGDVEIGPRHRSQCQVRRQRRGDRRHLSGRGDVRRAARQAGGHRLQGCQAGDRAGRQHLSYRFPVKRRMIFLISSRYSVAASCGAVR